MKMYPNGRNRDDLLCTYSDGWKGNKIKKKFGKIVLMCETEITFLKDIGRWKDSYIIPTAQKVLFITVCYDMSYRHIQKNLFNITLS